METIAFQTYLGTREAERSELTGFIFRQLGKGRRELLFWILQTLYWSFIGGIGLLMTRAFQTAVPDVWEVIFVRMGVGFFGTAGLRWIYQRRLFQSNGLMKWPAALACCVAFVLLEFVLLKAVAVAGITLPGGVEGAGPRLMVVRLFIVLIWSSLYFAIHLFENAHAMELRATQAELAARENELRHLQAQMNPYFLLNSLNMVLACKNDAGAVEEVTQGIANHLRFLFQKTRPLEPLSRELDALEKYLAVQASYHGENLVCRIQCEKAARSVMVPPMVIQPLLEDAFLHRIQTPEIPLQIWVTARVETDFLLVTVSNTGTRESVPPQASGDGLLALHQRLALLLGPKARVEQESENGWNRVTIHVPLADA